MLNGLQTLFKNTEFSNLYDFDKYKTLKSKLDKNYIESELSIPHKYFLIDQLLNLIDKLKDTLNCSSKQKLLAALIKHDFDFYLGVNK